MLKLERRTVLFSGRVQGVGFRVTAVRLSQDLAVWGTVRNLDDGRVELIVQGEANEIDTLISRLGEHFGSGVRNVQQVSSSAEKAAGKMSGIHVVH